MKKDRVGRCPMCDDPSCKLTFKDFFPSKQKTSTKKVTIKMKLNGHEYTQQEVFEALRKKGYLLLRYTYTGTDETFPGGIETYEINTHCALKGDDLPCEKNLWENVAIREFQKEFVKPPLV